MCGDLTLDADPLLVTTVGSSEACPVYLSLDEKVMNQTDGADTISLSAQGSCVVRALTPVVDGNRLEVGQGSTGKRMNAMH